MRNMNRMKSLQRQRGALIVVTLIFLLIVSMLASSTMDTTGLEMRMATNSRDQQLAFEAAEYTLSWVENEIMDAGGFSDNSISNNNCGAACFEDTCSNGYCFDGSSPLDWSNCQMDSPAAEVYESAALWADGSGKHRTLAVPGIGVSTKYIIEFRCYTALDSTQPMDATNNTRVYRTTAFAEGPGGRGRMMLRSTMKVF